MSTISESVDALYKVHKGKVEFVDVPELSYVSVEGQGEPGGEAYTDAIQALYTVSYAVHFALKKRTGEITRVMPLETLWWVDNPDPELLARLTTGAATMTSTDRALWRWQAIIMQPAPIDAAEVGQAIEASREKQLPALDRLRLIRWEEGRSAQILHVGPYADEGPTIVRLHEAIAAAGLKPRGRHHEIYLGDPRRSAPDKLRTLIRQPVVAGQAVVAAD